MNHSDIQSTSQSRSDVMRESATYFFYFQKYPEEFSLIIMNPNVTQKEISSGIVLLKYIHTHPTLLYIFKVQLNRLNLCDFIADFSGSENVLLENAKPNSLLSETRVEPFSTQEVARLHLKNDWKLKTKFKFTLKPCSKEAQLAFIQEELQLQLKQIDKAIQILKKVPYNHLEVSDVIKILDPEPFLDVEYPPLDKSVFGINLDPSVLDTVVQWRRPNQFFLLKDANKKPEIFFDKIEPNDIKQGALGNCWFLSALSSLAERPSLVRRLFVTTTVNQFGIYRVKLCINGEWIYITLDDFFPCYPMGSPIFSAAHGNELWVLLLEKAYAKTKGSYFALRSGLSSEAMIDLTGCPTEIILFDHDKLHKNYEKIWNTLAHYDDEGYLINAFTEGSDQWSEGQRPLGQQKDQIGLVPGHAYAVLQVKQVKGVKLLNLRNPWGNFEWKGDWSDTSPLWTQEMKGEVNFISDINDGQFWMCLKDFLHYFRGVNVCKVRNWDEVRVKGKFVKVTDVNDNNNQTVLSKWYYTVNLPTATKIIVGVHQEDERALGVEQLRGYLDIAVSVFKKSENSNLDLVKQTTPRIDRQIELELDLQPGQYLFLPRTSGLNLRRPPSAVQQSMELLEDGELSPLVKSTVADIFRKYDMLLTRELSFVEFKGFFDSIEKQIEPQQFKAQILGKYNSTEKGLTPRGLEEFFIDSIKTMGNESVWKWFEKLGYDRNLYTVRSRAFIFTLHSSTEVAVTVRDAINTDLDNRAHVFSCTSAVDENLLIEQLKLENEGVRALQCYNRLCDSFTVIAVNDQTHPVELSLDFSQSVGLIYSTKSAFVKKVLQSGQIECMLHFKGNGLQKFKVVIQAKWSPV